MYVNVLSGTDEYCGTNCEFKCYGYHVTPIIQTLNDHVFVSEHVYSIHHNSVIKTIITISQSVWTVIEQSRLFSRIVTDVLSISWIQNV